MRDKLKQFKGECLGCLKFSNIRMGKKRGTRIVTKKTKRKSICKKII